ncbi:transcriptional regulator [Polaromonas sp.]|uniref:transcriptional regulator n=1 Tax=Polaromonas sp. TaxID=1869339 RepID=UPI003BB4CA3E
MELKSWLEAESGRAVKLAKALKVYPSFISKLANGKKPVPFEQCMPIERATEGAVTRRDLRPDNYLIHWPELADEHTLPALPAINTAAAAQASIQHVEAVAVAAIRSEATQATAEIKHVAEELLKEDAPWDGATERRHDNAPWDGKTERRKLDAPVDRRVSPASVARAEFLRQQQGV